MQKSLYNLTMLKHLYIVLTFLVILGICFHNVGFLVAICVLLFMFIFEIQLHMGRDIDKHGEDTGYFSYHQDPIVKYYEKHIKLLELLKTN